MKKINLTLAVLAVLSTMAAANADQTTTTESYTYTKEGDQSSSTTNRKSVIAERKTDKEILKLLDAKIDSYPDLDDDVSFTVQDGIVTLKGTVENTSERDHSGMIAAAIPGVVRVDNLIDTE